MKKLAAIAEGCAHDLCGRIVQTAPFAKGKEGNCFDDPWFRMSSDIARALHDGGTVLLGETHDNATHHELQAAAIEEWGPRNSGAADKIKAVVFEQFQEDQQTILDGLKGSQKPLAEFKKALSWEKSGWAQYNYDPLFEAVLGAELPLYAGDVTRDAIKKAAKQGAGSFPEAERARLKLDVPLGEKLDAASRQEIEESHCGMLPKEAVPRMAFAQRYRDAHMADVLLEAAKKDGSAVLIAGDGHVRSDRGVPWYIRQRAPGRPFVSVMLTEVEDGKTEAEAYVPRDADGKAAADYLIFTPRFARGDPCEGMRKK